MDANAAEATGAERRQPVLVLQATELRSTAERP
jgi:hypothetical protein